MFKSATFRLTAWYALIIMFISILFSVSLYEVSLHELDDRLHQQMVFLLPRVPKIRAEIVNQHNIGSHALLVDLVYFNLIVLVAATTASYLLARQTLEPIEEAHEMQTRFAADASHELRTPLTAMKSEIEVALRDSKLSPSECKALLASNLEEVDRLVTLTNVLLEITRHDVRSGSGSGAGKVEMTDVVREAKSHVAKMAKQRKIDLSVDTVLVKVKGDKASLVELLVIFLDNAIKYSRKDSKVHIGLSRQGHYAVVTIYDHGVGIGKEDLEHIFERFYRADQSRSKEKTSGFGLGLSLAKLIADRHDGRIIIESDLGKGTLVRLQLPLATDSRPLQAKKH